MSRAPNYHIYTGFPSLSKWQRGEILGNVDGLDVKGFGCTFYGSGFCIQRLIWDDRDRFGFSEEFSIIDISEPLRQFHYQFSEEDPAVIAGFSLDEDFKEKLFKGARHLASNIENRDSRVNFQGLLRELETKRVS